MNPSQKSQKDTAKRKARILVSIYGSSLWISLIALSIAAAMEIFMLIYTALNSEMFGSYLWRYRTFYLILLSVAVIFIALVFYVKRDIERRYLVVHFASPICAMLFFSWALVITYSDFQITGVVDPIVFMTFSLIVPLVFFLFPGVYAAIVLVTDCVMVYLTVIATGGTGQLINILIFSIFQFVLGISFFHLKMQLAERIVNEQDNAGIDALTGLKNRRSYEEDLRSFQIPLPQDLCFIIVDINGLKETNDSRGHNAGDQIIIGTAQCMEQCFGEKGTSYRIGGDEYAVILSATQNEAEGLLKAFDESIRNWSNRNHLTLGTSWGCVCAAEHPEMDIDSLAKAADEKMYEAKAVYYKTSGYDRRKYLS